MVNNNIHRRRFVFIKNSMKRFIFLCMFGITVFHSTAQIWGIPNLTTFDDRRIHFGFTLGINTLDMRFTHYNTLNDNPAFNADAVGNLNSNYLSELDSVGRIVRADIASLTPGFTVGIVSNLRLARNLDLRFLPGLSFGNRKILYNVPIHDLNNSDNVDLYNMRSTYLDFPLLLKYKSKRIVNQRPYLLGGFAFRFDISKAANEELLRFKKAGFFAEAGMGWDSYMQNFRLSYELKYSFGLNNSLTAPPEDPQPQYYTMAFKHLAAHMLVFSLHFE